jgi:DNA-directed RNA polymerase subunit RPC12/RpoP
MPVQADGIGIIAIVCSSCSAKLYWYVIGDGPDGNRNKFNGPPSPQRALAGFDRGECPVCGARLSAKPRRIEIMTVREFQERYVVTDYQVLERKTLVEEQLEAAGVLGSEAEAVGVEK